MVLIIFLGVCCLWAVTAGMALLLVLPSNTTSSPGAAGRLSQRMKRTAAHAAERQVSRFIRQRLEAREFETDWSVEELIARLFDRRLDAVSRYRDAYRLARAGTPQAVAALRQFFQTASAEEKAAIAQWLGAWGNPQNKGWLWPLLRDPDSRVVVGAIRGLAAIGGEDVRLQLASLLLDEQTPTAVRIEAAIGLGTLRTESALDALVSGFEKNRDPDVAEAVLTSLGRFPFPEIETMWRDFLSSEQAPPELRVTAVEALAESGAEAVPFLFEVARDDADWEVRAAAAWVLSTHGAFDGGGPALVALAEAEEDELVRRRLYEALWSQRDIPVSRLRALVEEETDTAARVAAFNALGAAVGRAGTPAEWFDEKVVPELLQTALQPQSLNLRMRAVFALRRARTEGSFAALRQLSEVPEPRVATAARNGLH